MYSFVSNKRPNPLGGDCYSCGHCYIHGSKGMKNRFNHLKVKYSGEFKLYPHILDQIRNINSDKPVFFCDCIDYMHKDNSVDNILDIFYNIKRNKHDTLFLSVTKNPSRYIDLIKYLPRNMILGATIESNIDYSIYSDAPLQTKRIRYMKNLNYVLQKHGMNNLTFWSIEPVLKFDFDIFLDIIESCSPTYGVALGYDNHKYKMHEPSLSDTMALRMHLIGYGIRVFDKSLRKAWWE